MSVTILCYHKVGSGSVEGRRLNIEPERLRSHVRFFARKKHNFLLARDLGKAWTGGLVCFTFDDAFDSTMANAPEILESAGARGSFYAVPGLVGKTSEWEGELARPLATWDTLRTVQAQGHEIGNHSFHHPFLARLGPEEQGQEITSAHKRLIDEGLQPGSFCFPYGDHNENTLEKLKTAGYKVGLALGKRPARQTDDLLRLPRIVVAYSDSLPGLMYKLYLKPLIRRT